VGAAVHGGMGVYVPITLPDPNKHRGKGPPLARPASAGVLTGVVSPALVRQVLLQDRELLDSVRRLRAKSAERNRPPPVQQQQQPLYQPPAETETAPPRPSASPQKSAAAAKKAVPLKPAPPKPANSPYRAPPVGRTPLRFQTTHRTHFGGTQFRGGRGRGPMFKPPHNPPPYPSDHPGGLNRTTSQDAFQPLYVKPRDPIRPDSAGPIWNNVHGPQAMCSTYNAMYRGYFNVKQQPPFIRDPFASMMQYDVDEPLPTGTTSKSAFMGLQGRNQPPFVPPVNPPPYEYASAGPILHRSTSHEGFPRPPSAMVRMRDPFVPPTNPAPYTRGDNVFEPTPTSTSHTQFCMGFRPGRVVQAPAGRSDVDPSKTAGWAIFGDDEYM